ncbi:MAG: metallophosphoesterase [bacterium]
MTTVRSFRPCVKRIAFHLLLFALIPASLIVFTRYSKGQGFESQQTLKLKLNGEYGLWVEERGGRIVINWITQDPDSGFLKVLNNDTQRVYSTTPSSQAHRIAFEKPDAKSLVLQYGGLKNDLDKHATTIYLNRSKPERKYTFNKVDSVYVFGDVHGEYNNLIQILRKVKIIDSNLNWIANRKHLVFLGDIFDRGYDVTKTLWFLYNLEKQAKEHGGYVHILLGNHEIMTFSNDLRYLSAKENLIAKLHSTEYSNMFDIHHSILGEWLASKPGIIKINKILFAHGGVTPYYTNYSIESFNDSLYSYLHDDLFKYLLADSSTIDSLLLTHADSLQFGRRLHYFFADNSVFWHRGYVVTDTLESDLKKVLKKFKSKLHVVGHTTVNTIQEFYDGKVIAVDLEKPVTEMLLLVRKGSKKYRRYKYDLNGTLESL